MQTIRNVISIYMLLYKISIRSVRIAALIYTREFVMPKQNIQLPPTPHKNNSLLP